MLLERFGLWEARHDRVASYSRGMTQRLALCRVLLHEPRAARARRAVHARSTRPAPSCSTRSSPSCAASARSSSPPTTPRASSRSRRQARARDMNYFRDVRALARKDLLLELRARDTLPAMLLFVVAIFVVFHFSLPGTPSMLAASGLPLGRDPLHRAARPRARVRPRAGAADVRRARARAVRPQRDLAREVARDARLPRRRRARRAAALRALLPPDRRRDGRGVRCSPTSASARSGRSSARWPSSPARATCCCRSSSCRSRSRS